MRRKVVSIGPATRAPEPGAAESDRAEAARWAGTDCVSGNEAPMACVAWAAGTSQSPVLYTESQSPEAGPGRGTSVAAFWDRSGAGVLARGQARSSAGRRAYSCWRGRVRYAWRPAATRTGVRPTGAAPRPATTNRRRDDG